MKRSIAQVVGSAAILLMGVLALVGFGAAGAQAQHTVKNYFTGCQGANCDNVLTIGGTWKIGSTAVTPTAAVLNAVPAVYTGGAIVSSKKLAYGQQSTVAASDTVVTGLTTVVSCMASYDTDPADANFLASCSVGDQAGTPAAGSILIKTWQNTSGTDPTPTAAGSFTKKVNWIAMGS